jgi:hypothetical protein
MFEQLGKAMGYQTRRSWTRSHPTDGVWLNPGHDTLGLGHLPVVAIEVLVTEGAKSSRGSLATLTAVSPSVGILLVHEEEISRGMLRKGISREAVDAEIEARRADLLDAANRTPQRIVVWAFSQLRRHLELAIGRSRPAAQYAE